MKTFANQLAGLATLALAVLPVAALSTAAHAQPSPRSKPATTVRIADLDLDSASGMASFHQRVGAAARQFCANERGLDREYACRAGVRSEMTEKLAALRPATRLAAR